VWIERRLDLVDEERCCVSLEVIYWSLKAVEILDIHTSSLAKHPE